jgi:hypothetical protein
MACGPGNLKSNPHLWQIGWSPKRGVEQRGHWFVIGSPWLKPVAPQAPPVLATPQ